MNTRSAPLDLLRTIAIFLVFTSHFHSFAKDWYFGRLGEFGWVGVDLFFALSGFLISSQLFKEIKRTKSISFKDFYTRRGFRIWPNYFVVLMVYFWFPAFWERSQLAPLWKYFTFTLNFGLDYGKTGAFSHAWSLCVEEQFYFILPPLLIVLVPRLNFKKTCFFLSMIVLLGVALRYEAWQRWILPFEKLEHKREMYSIFYREIYYPTYCRLDSLAVGVAIGALLQFKSDLWSRYKKFANYFLILALSLLLLSFWLEQDEYGVVASTLGYPLNALAFGFLMLAALSTEGILSRFKGRYATASANLAFAFYLTHKAMIHHSKIWLSNLGLDPGSILYPILILGVCTATSAILYFMIEKPFLKIRDRVLRLNRNIATF